MGLTYEEAQRCGIAHLWPDASKRPRAVEQPAVSNAPDDGMNKLETHAIGGKVFTDFDSKLEWQFWQRLWASFEAGEWSEVDAHCLKVRAIGDASWFSVDFVARRGGMRTIYETKGYLREKDKLRLIGAAARYPEWQWVIAMRVRRKWECRQVTRSGISREVFTPPWLA